MRAIADSRTLPRLRELDLSRCEVNDAMCEALATASGFQLKVLRLAHCRVGARGVRSLLESAATKHLEVLDLTGVTLDAATQQLLGERGLA